MSKQHGFSLIELLIVVAIILVLAGIAIPNLMRSRIAANEASTVSSLRTINSAEIAYNISHNTYTCTLADLGPGGSSLIDGNLSSGNKSGYSFVPGPDCPAGTTITSYQWVANPASSSSGTRHFCTSEEFIIKVDPNNGDNCLTIGSPVG